jgi:rSAM/selenodomain-associated transferase 1
MVIVFAKAPRPGLVKTRMTPPLTPDVAAELYGHLLDDVLDATAAFSDALGLQPVVALHPAEACASIAQRVPHSFRVIAQQGSGLAERMTWAVGEAAAAGAQRILLRGSDNPVLPRRVFEEALESLDRHDLVISPDLDGGYGLVGVRTAARGLFDHPMSRSDVLDETLRNARRLGLRYEVLASSFDIDTIDDLAQLQHARSRGDTALCPRTMAFADDRDLWRYAPTSAPSI